MKGQGKEFEEPTPAIKSQINKFNKRKPNSGTPNNGSSTGLDQLHMSEKDINVSTADALRQSILFPRRNYLSIIEFACVAG